MVPLVSDPLGCGVVRVTPSCTTASQTPHEPLNLLVSGSPKPQRRTLPKLVEFSMKAPSSELGELLCASVQVGLARTAPHGRGSTSASTQEASAGLSGPGWQVSDDRPFSDTEKG
jgi:hypothetical protein